MERSIFICPPLPCRDCGRHTHLAHIISYPNEHYSFSPQCAWHGFMDFVGPTPTKEEQTRVYASIERFVVAHYDNVGSAIVLEQATLSEVPGYQRSELHINDASGNPLSAESIERMRFEDKAFSCQYIDAEGQERHCWAVWNYALLEFEMYEQTLDQASL